MVEVQDATNPGWVYCTRRRWVQTVVEFRDRQAARRRADFSSVCLKHDGSGNPVQTQRTMHTDRPYLMSDQWWHICPTLTFFPSILYPKHPN